MLALSLQYFGSLKFPDIFMLKIYYIALLLYVEAHGLSDHEEVREEPIDCQCIKDTLRSAQPRERVVDWRKYQVN